MSAAVAMLPRLPVYEETVSSTLGALEAGFRKQPHRLRLVQACEEAVPEAQAPVFPLEVVPAEAPAPVAVPRLEFYRKYTEAMLRRYMTLSMEAARAPSLLGRELFGGNVSHCKVQAFDDVVIYVADVEKCLAKLDFGQQHLIRRIALHGYTQAETSAMLGIALRTVIRRYGESLDRLTAMFLRLGLMERGKECLNPQQ
jgi:hypothetical protein